MVVGNKRQRMKKIRETYFRERAILKYASVDHQENHGGGRTGKPFKIKNKINVFRRIQQWPHETV